MRGSILLQVSLLLCLVGCSLQGGTGSVQSPVSSPLAVKAGGRYPQFGPQGYQQGPTGVRNGYEAGYGVKAGKPVTGSLGVLPAGKQKPGYGNGRYPSNFQQQGIGANPSKAGYGNGAGLYPSNIQQQGIGGKPPKAGYGSPSGGLPNVGVQPGYGNGAGLYPSNVQQPGTLGKPSKAGYGSSAGVLIGFLNGPGGFPSNIQQPGFGSKPSKAGYGTGNYPRFGAQPGYGAKPSKAGLGAKSSKAGALQQPYPGGLGSKPSKAGYPQGVGNYPRNIPQQGSFQQPYPGGPQEYIQGAAGYPNNYPQQGLGTKPSKAGAYQQPYPNVAGGYPQAVGNYPSGLQQQGLGAKPSKAGAFQQQYPNGAYQQPYPNGLNNFLGNGKGQGVKSPFASLGALGKSSKQGALGKLPYKSQPLPADALGYDSKSLKSGGAQLPFTSQAGYPDPASVKYGGVPVPYGPQGAYPDPSAIKYGGVPQYPETASSPLEEDLSQTVPLEGTQIIAVGPTTPPTTQASPSTPKQKAYKVPEEQAAYRFYGTGYQGCAEC
ncbi:glutenin, high molecular weight subunit PW212 isoform X6 [Xenopus laevis]|uniref:Glutenin, high molecular weight subunit PW212 isoform X6 n=1 Tax=Xenopus laevis TaxID=8355 RepID=A0A8J0TWR4_XENLA|nr:glutenin, high molecular weight subunit PW212 isoform X6 [Xenopus laevis]